MMKVKPMLVPLHATAAAENQSIEFKNQQAVPIRSLALLPVDGTISMVKPSLVRLSLNL